MAIVQFTPGDALQAALPPITPDYSSEVSFRIVPPEDHDCDGVQCGGRPESALSAEEHARWLDRNAWRPPMPRHSHLIVVGKKPDTRESICPILAISSTG